MAVKFHTPVLLKEAIEFLSLKPGGIYVDATLGGGGHSESILKTLNGKGKLTGIDQDEEAINEARLRLSGRIELVQDNFSNIKNILKGKKINGILFDLGVSSHQIDSPDRGFSLRVDGPLDMRMDKTLKMSAADIVNSWSIEDIAKIIKEYGEEKFAKKIARSIESARKRKKISTTLELVEIINQSLKPFPPKVKMDGTTRTFQALRITVNDELNKLKKALVDSIDALDKGGRIVVISYHSLEDRIVKTIFRDAEKKCVCPPKVPVCTCAHEQKLKILTKKPVVPAEEEVTKNPRARSAKLRAAERI